MRAKDRGPRTEDDGLGTAGDSWAFPVAFTKRRLTGPPPLWEIPIMAQSVTIEKHDKRKRLVLPDDFVAEAPYGEYIIREGKGYLSIIAIPAPKIRRTYAATPALERKLREAKGARELINPLAPFHLIYMIIAGRGAVSAPAGSPADDRRGLGNQPLRNARKANGP